MPRSPAFRALRSLRAARALAKHQDVPLDVGWHARLKRRDLLKAAGLLAAAPLAACAEPAARLTDARPASVAIVGAGIAGLHCAWRLRRLGIAATVFDAQDRVGGRILSDRVTFAAQSGQHCELGGELIDTPHATMIDLAAEFSLPLLDYRDDDPTLARTVAHFGGENVSIEDILTDYEPIAARIDADVTAADSDDSSFATLDALSIADWFDALEAEGVIAAGNRARPLFEVAYNIEYGREVHEQSVLNMLYLAGTGTEELALFGISDELLHVAGGNDAITTALARGLPGQIEGGKRLVRVRTTSSGLHTLSFDDGVERTFEHVVFALPFTLLREVDLSTAALSDDKRFAIDEIGYGTNAKLMMGFSSRVWRTAHDSNGESFTDLPAQATWETSRLQDGDEGILTNYTGGLSGLAVGAGSPADATARALGDLDQVFPGLRDAHNGRVARFHWPTQPFSKGSYACYLPGQWSSISGFEGTTEGTLYFCGEHASIEAQGYMEGGAETGARCAVEVADAIGARQALLVDGPEARILTRARTRIRHTRARRGMMRL